MSKSEIQFPEFNWYFRDMTPEEYSKLQENDARYKGISLDVQQWIEEQFEEYLKELEKRILEMDDE